jgi:oxygen-independent coproporphyrinogen-3 oxidase
VPVLDVMEARARSHQEHPKKIALYVATPYCLPTDPDRCGFCLFPSEEYRGKDQLETYLRYLEREGELYRPFVGGERVASIYFGGGTANLYRPEGYSKLLNIVSGLFDLSSVAEVTLEGIPQLFTHEKLHAAKLAGFTRVSIGVQQLSDDMIKLSGRKQTAKQAFQTIEWCHALGLEASVDLIFGWPGQTPERMLADLRQIVASGVRHITHYELNVGGRSDFARNHRETLPSVEANLELYRLSRDFLKSCGYSQATVYDWEKLSDGHSARYKYEGDLRSLLSFDEAGAPGGTEMWGWGFAGVTNLLGTPSTPGSVYMNHSRVAAYFEKLDRGEFPIERGFCFEREDVRLTWLFQSLQGMSIDRGAYTRLFTSDVLEDAQPLWMALRELGWAEVTPSRVQLVNDGPFYIPLIQTLLAEARGEAIRKDRSAGLARRQLEGAA